LSTLKLILVVKYNDLPYNTVTHLVIIEFAAFCALALQFKNNFNLFSDDDVILDIVPS